MPNVGPCDGWRIHAMVFTWTWAASAWHKPIVVVLFPSPSGVGVILHRSMHIYHRCQHYPTSQCTHLSPVSALSYLAVYTDMSYMDTLQATFSSFSCHWSLSFLHSIHTCCTINNNNAQTLLVITALYAIQQSRL